MGFVLVHHLEIEFEVAEVVLLGSDLVVGYLFQVGESLIYVQNVLLEPSDLQIDVSADLHPLQNLEMDHILINDLIIVLI